MHNCTRFMKKRTKHYKRLCSILGCSDRVLMSARAELVKVRLGVTRTVIDRANERKFPAN